MLDLQVFADMTLEDGPSLSLSESEETRMSHESSYLSTLGAIPTGLILDRALLFAQLVRDYT